MTIVPITSNGLDAAEVSFFSALCSDDYQYLGVPEGHLRSSWSHCSEIVKTSEKTDSATYFAHHLIRLVRTHCPLLLDAHQ